MFSIDIFHRIDKRLNLSKRDYTLAGAMVLVYAAVALFNLGACKFPQTYWISDCKGESFYVDLGTSKSIDRVAYLLGLGEGSYEISFSDSAKEWGNEQIIEHQSRYTIIVWEHIDTDIDARYMKVTSKRPGIMLSEMGLFTVESSIPINIKSVVTFNMAEENAAKVFDEQETLVYYSGFHNSMYFDETYHARAGYEYALGMESSENTHPPLGKLIISLGINIFGMTPFGWRIMGTVFGILMIPIMYLFGKQLFKKTEYAFLAAFLLAFDFIHFVQTRIATIDVYAVFFIILMNYFMYNYFSMNIYHVAFKKTLPPLLLSGIFLGLGIASKWIAVYGAVGLAVLFFSSIGMRYREYLKAKIILATERTIITEAAQVEYESVINTFPRYAIATLAVGVAFFLVVPVLIYILSFVPSMIILRQSKGVQDVLETIKHMYKYHSTLDATRWYSSKWWQWPIMVRPICYYCAQAVSSPEKISTIVALGNPSVWWIGILAFVAAAIIGAVKNDRRMYFIFVATASQYVPWIIIPRTLVFIYHFFATVPFMILSIVYVCAYFKEKYQKTRYVIYVYMVAVIFLFIMFYPVLSGMEISKSYIVGFLKWLKTWFLFV